MKFFALIFKELLWKTYSFILKFILVNFYNFKIGKNFYCEGTPKLKLKNNEKIIIGNYVKILGDIDFRTRESGKIKIGDNVKIEENCRFVAAKMGKIEIGDNCSIGCNAIWNGGGDIIVHRNCIFSARSSVNANEHLISKSKEINKQGYKYGDVKILEDCFIGVNTSISKNVLIKKGVVIGANSYVNSNLEEYTVYAGSPAKKIKEREQ